MIGYLSMGGVTMLMHILQTYMGQTRKEGEKGHETDYGYLPPIEEPGVDGLFETWWDPVTDCVTEDDSEDGKAFASEVLEDDEEAPVDVTEKL
jgi:hypothetical protein